MHHGERPSGLEHLDASNRTRAAYRVRARLYEQGMEMSGLVEEMLREWIEKQPGK